MAGMSRRGRTIARSLRARDFVTLVEGRLADDADVERIGGRVRALARILGVRDVDCESLGEIADRVARRTVREAGGGHADVFLTWAVGEPMLVTEVHVAPAPDAGRSSDAGEADLLASEEVEAARRVLDHVHVSGAVGNGRTIELGRALRDPEALSDRRLELLADHAAAEMESVPASVHRRSRHLVRALQAMRRRWAEIRQSAGRLALLDRLGEAFGPLRPSDVLLRSVALTIVPSWADGCAVILEDSKGERFHHVTALAAPGAAADRDPVLAFTPPEGATASELGIDSTQLARADLRVAHAAFDRAAAGEGLEVGAMREHVVVAPLRDRDQALGILAVARANTPFSADDLGLLQSIASRLAVSHQNARILAMLQGASQSRDRVLGMVAHELRRPLNVLSLDIARLENAAEDDARVRAVQRLDESVQFMDRLVSDLLDVSSFERGLLSMHRRPLDLRAVVEDVTASQATRFENAGVRLRVVVDPRLPLCWGDRHRIHQVLGNLVDNALAYAPRGTEVHVRATLARSRRVLVSVADQGPGIPHEEQAHVFKAFFRGSSSRRRGMGLGLMIAREIVLGHGGRIWLRSQPGAGTTFHFSLPIGTPPESA